MKFLILLLLPLLLFGCTNVKNTESSNNEKPRLIRITAQEGKERLDKEKDIILLDVRTVQEYNEGYIENAILLPLDELEDKADEVIPDKEATYFIYCRSGRRSAIAGYQLIEMGYKNVYDMGGVLDWPYGLVRPNR